MAKQLLLNVLTDTLGKYIEGLVPENLKLGVWAGSIELNNIRLKAGCVDDLNLPIVVRSGNIQ
jgi:hypothetical protein